MCSIDRLFSKPLLKIHGKEGRKRRIPFRSKLFNSVLSKLHGSFLKVYPCIFRLHGALNRSGAKLIKGASNDFINISLF